MNKQMKYNRLAATSPSTQHEGGGKQIYKRRIRLLTELELNPNELLALCQIIHPSLHPFIHPSIPSHIPPNFTAINLHLLTILGVLSW